MFLTTSYNPKDLVGRHFWEFADPKSDRIIAKSFQEVLKSDELTSFEVTLTSKFGREVTFHITARTIYDNNSRNPELLAVAKDITKINCETERANDLSIKLMEAKRLISIERDRANRRNSILDELSRLKNEFASNVSHEFRTPLSLIINPVEKLTNESNISNETKEKLKLVLKSSYRIHRLINISASVHFF